MNCSIILRTRTIEITKFKWPLASITYHNIKSCFTCSINYIDDLKIIEYILKHLNVKYEVESNTTQTDYCISISYDEYQKLIFLLKLEGEYKDGMYIFSFDSK